MAENISQESMTIEQRLEALEKKVGDTASNLQLVAIAAAVWVISLGFSIILHHS